MTPVTVFADRMIAVFGLGGSGLATAEALIAGGADVVAWDDSQAGLESARQKGIVVKNFEGLDWSKIAALVLSPGVPLTHPQPHWTAQLAFSHHVEIIGDMELFARERQARAPSAPLLAITGTNGKSTTTALVAHLLRTARRDVQLGGNIGTAILLLDPPAFHRVHVIECSSFQIDLAPTLSPTIGVLLNITEDHLDRHGTMENYVSIKTRLVAQSDIAVICVDDGYTQRVADVLEREGRRVVRVSTRRPLADGVYAQSNTVMLAEAGASKVVAHLGRIGSLRGEHNAQNACAAFAVLLAMGISADEIAAGLRTFPGLAHRMEQVGTVGSVLFVNDSKATNADAAAKAMASFQDIFWIAGGKAKSGGIASLQPYFPSIAKAYLIGEAADLFAATLDGQADYVIADTIDEAVLMATADALASSRASPVILLSPACASYDQFRNFEERGAAFRDCVKVLPGFQSILDSGAQDP